ncbi:ATP-binding protein [Streptomyces sp. NPDC020096]
MSRPQPLQSGGLVCTWTSCTPGPAARARAALRCTLDDWGLSGGRISDLILAASELVANATEHAMGPYELWLHRTAVALMCEVHDHDPHMPKLPEFSATAPFSPDPKGRGGGLDVLCALLSERGRGLQIVNHLFRGCWGFRLPGNGKKVAWIAFPAELHQLQHDAELPPGGDLGFVTLEE